LNLEFKPKLFKCIKSPIEPFKKLPQQYRHNPLVPPHSSVRFVVQIPKQHAISWCYTLLWQLIQDAITLCLTQWVRASPIEPRTQPDLILYQGQALVEATQAGLKLTNSFH
jgi:hypothetical protein